MKKYKLTDNQCSMLTEFIGGTVKPDKEYHCYGKIRETGETNNCYCFIEGCRTFATDSDMMVVRKMLRDKRLWDNFFNYLALIDIIPISFNAGEFWLNRESLIYLDENPERFCWLVAKFLEERK